MSLATLARKNESGGSSKAAAPSMKPASGLQIGNPDSVFEQQADRVADEIMTSEKPRIDWSFSRIGINSGLYRKCDCDGSSGCADCGEKETVQRKAVGSAQTNEAPPIVNEVLRSSGKPLDQDTRTFFESRLGYDFGSVRVHADTRAAESARAVNAMAYTVGDHLAFADGRYAPRTTEGRRLMAHELFHVVQQRPQSNVSSAALGLEDPSSHAEAQADRGADAFARGESINAHGAADTSHPVVARACFTKEQCETKTERTPQQLMEEETSKPENKNKRDTRKADCTKKPPAASCTADGHGARAVETEKVLHDYDPTRLKFIKKIVVDMDMESGFGGLTGDCSSFMPPIKGGGLCTFIPAQIETEAGKFNNTMEPKIGGVARDLWRDQTLSTLEHETEHARFDAAPIAPAKIHTCNFADIEDALSEIAAMLAEFPVIWRGSRENVSLTPQKKEKMLDNWFTFRITDEDQSFKSTLHSIYCACECADANVYLKKTIDFTTADWSQAEKIRFHTELQDPKWSAHDLRWPVAPPPAAAAKAGSPP